MDHYLRQALPFGPSSVTPVVNRQSSIPPGFDIVGELWEDRRPAMERRSAEISIRKPFSLKATALSHGWHECAPMSWCEVGECLQVIERVGGMPVRLSLRQGSAKGDHVRVRVTLEASELRDADVAGLRRRAAIMLRQDLELDEFYALARAHPDLKAVEGIGAGRILRSASMAENIVKTQCATNVNWTQAVKMINRIAQLGPCLTNFRNLNAWPTPQEILSAGEDYLLNVARLGYRTKSVLAFCRSVVDGSFDPEGLDACARTESTDELYARLLFIKGIGPSSAGFLLGLLGRFDRMSIDSWTIAYVGKRYMNGRKPTTRQVEDLYERYGRWRDLVWWFEQWLEWETARSML